MKYAVIDVGTNNILFLIAERSEDKIIMLHRDANITALGKNMKNGLLCPSAIKRTKRILTDNIGFARMFTDKIIVVGTSCSREATNINLLGDWLQQRHHLKYTIISGETEANLNGLANIKEFPEFENIIMFDVGGGSTEFSVSQKGKIIFNQSLPLGIRRLDNQYAGDFAQKTEATRQILQALHLPKIPNTPVIGIGGTVTSLSAYKQHLAKYDGSLVHKSRLTRTEVGAMLEEFQNMTDDEIAFVMPFDRYRADIIATGTMIVQEILDRLDIYDFYISDRGLQFGILRQSQAELEKYL
ncbi:MAG TPA: hypothetical protein PLD62_00740 [Candidatus Cloacimonadota bacterium]|nr:hypothetical protein [Candidatus Cloacimonadota bacterium]